MGECYCATLGRVEAATAAPFRAPSRRVHPCGHSRAMRTDLPRGAVTLVFTDIEGSTRLLHELGPDGYAGALAAHRRVIRDACRANGGVEVDTQGDAFFLAF